MLLIQHQRKLDSVSTRIRKYMYMHAITTQRKTASLRQSGRPLALRQNIRPTARTSAQRKTAFTSTQRRTAHTSVSKVEDRSQFDAAGGRLYILRRSGKPLAMTTTYMCRCLFAPVPCPTERHPNRRSPCMHTDSLPNRLIHVTMELHVRGNFMLLPAAFKALYK